MFFNRQKSFTQIVSSFKRTVDELDNLISSNDIQVKCVEEELTELEIKRRSLKSENEQAERVKNKIAEIIS